MLLASSLGRSRGGFLFRAVGRPRAAALSSSNGGDGEMTWQECVEQLISPTGSAQEKSILLQSLAARAPEIGGDVADAVRAGAPEQLLAPGTQGARVAEGVAAVRRQLLEDLLPSATAEVPRAASSLIADPRAALGRLASSLPLPSDPSALRDPAALVGAWSALQEEARTVFASASTADGPATPAYAVLPRRADGFELREYAAYAECSTPVAASDGDGAPELASSEPEAALLTELLGCARGFSALSRFVAGENAAREPVVMSAPVILSYDGADARGASAGIATVAFPIVSGGGAAAGAGGAPLPDDPAVSVSERPAETLAVAEVRASARARARARARETEKREPPPSRNLRARAVRGDRDRGRGSAAARGAARRARRRRHRSRRAGSAPRLLVQPAVHAALPAPQRAGRRRRASR